MTWESMENYQQLVEMHPALTEQRHRKAFADFLNRMWTKPATLTEFVRAYMEFTTSNQHTFPKLNALFPVEDSGAPPSRSKRTRRRRSRRNRK